MTNERMEQEIVCEFWEGATKAFLGRKYGVSPRTVGRMIKRNPDLGPPESDMTQEELPLDQKEEDVKLDVILNESQITVVKGDESETIHKGQAAFSEVFDLIWNNKASQDSLREAFQRISVREQLELSFGDKVEVDKSKGVVRVQTDTGTVSINGRLHSRLTEAAQEGTKDKLEGLVNFTHKLAENPSDSVLDELYEFLEACDIEITKEGYVECFKRVRDDYMDCYSGRFDNSVGQTPSIPRNQVDSDSSSTCSKGLHVCSKSYLPYYGGARVMKVLVDPADFVSIPNDYYSSDGVSYRAKARVCGYKVVAEIT